MTIEQHGKTGWRITFYEDGVRHRISVPQKPTKTEALFLIDEYKERKSVKAASECTFRDAINKYVSEKRDLGISQKREYVRLPNRIPKWFLDKNIFDIGQDDMDKLVDELSKRLNRYGEPLSPKSIKNYYHQITPILAKYAKKTDWSTDLPTVHKKSEEDVYIPSTSDVKSLLQYALKSEPTYYVPLVLGSYGLRRGEILPLTADDVVREGEIWLLNVNKAIAVDEHGEMVEKDTKTVYSKRQIGIPEDIAKYILAHGYAYNGYINNLTNFMGRAEDELGLEHFSFHKLRHYFLSKMLEEGVDFQTALYLGGWSKSSNVAKDIYLHSLKGKEINEKARISALLAKSIM